MSIDKEWIRILVEADDLKKIPCFMDIKCGFKKYLVQIKVGEDDECLVCQKTLRVKFVG